jgi:hypothetical protein
LAALLGERVTLTSSSGFRLEREPTPVALFLPIGARSYLEAPGRRLPLGSRFSLLVSAEAANDPGVGALVGGASPESRDGCPPGSILYRDLELHSVPAIPRESELTSLLERLIPTAQEAVIDLRGGIAVAGPTRAGRAWLACDPPSILIAGATGQVEVQLHVNPADGAEDTIEPLSDRGGGLFQRAEGSSALPAGAHYLYVTRGSSTLARQKLQLVSSDTPRIESRPLAHVLASSAVGAISAGPATPTRSIQGADWTGLVATLPELPTLTPPSELRVLEASPGDEGDDETLTIGRGHDVRPERYRARRRRRTTLQQALGGLSTLEEVYRHEIAKAVAAGQESFEASDGTRWRIRYFEDKNEIFVGPLDGYAPCGRFAVSYD